MARPFVPQDELKPCPDERQGNQNTGKQWLVTSGEWLEDKKREADSSSRLLVGMTAL